MEIHQLQYVLAVSKHNSFTRAAEEIKVSQSSLSQQINKLENELGINLFLRTTRSVHLTSAGKDFVIHASRIVSELQETRQNMLEYVSIEKGHLSVGVLPTIVYYHFPSLLASFQKNYPGVKISLLESQCEDLLHMLHTSEIDAAILSQTRADSDIIFYPMFVDRLVVVTSKNHPLSLCQSVTLNDLKNEEFIVPPENSGHYQDFHAACQTAGFEPVIAMSCPQVQTILALVEEELGITVLSSYGTRVKSPNLTVIPLLPTIHRKIVLAVRKNTDISPALKVFVNYTSQWLDLNR